MNCEDLSHIYKYIQQRFERFLKQAPKYVGGWKSYSSFYTL